MKITELLFLHPLLYLGDRSTGMTLKYFNSCFKAYSCKELKLVKKSFIFSANLVREMICQNGKT